jgi:hypothetical protein
MLLILIIVLIVTGVIGGGTYYRHQNGTQTPAAPRYNSAAPDLPVALGFRSRWISVRTNEEEKLVTQLKLQNLRRTHWREGAFYAAQGSLFVTPPIDNWTVVMGLGLRAPDSPQNIEAIKQLLIELSRNHREANYFCSDTPNGLHCWIKAEKGEIVRLHSWNLKAGAKALSEGTPTPVESELLRAFEAGEPQGPGLAKMNMEVLVMRVADSWGLKFMTLGNRMDILGKLGWLGNS